MKETQAAVLRVTSGLSTREIECAKLGNDYREIFEQLLREKKAADAAGLDFNTAPTKPGTNNTQDYIELKSDAVGGLEASNLTMVMLEGDASSCR